MAEDDILAAFRAGESLEALQTCTKCGTHCDSCVLELKRLQQSIRTHLRLPGCSE